MEKTDGQEDRSRERRRTQRGIYGERQMDTEKYKRTETDGYKVRQMERERQIDT